ncbi:hypothetical protein VTK56DRAFT_7570 [Thermocarpiscus australiensis]
MAQRRQAWHTLDRATRRKPGDGRQPAEGRAPLAGVVVWGEWVAVPGSCDYHVSARPRLCRAPCTITLVRSYFTLACTHEGKSSACWNPTKILASDTVCGEPWGQRETEKNAVSLKTISCAGFFGSPRDGVRFIETGMVDGLLRYQPRRPSTISGARNI